MTKKKPTKKTAKAKTTRAVAKKSAPVHSAELDRLTKQLAQSLTRTPAKAKQELAAVKTTLAAIERGEGLTLPPAPARQYKDPSPWRKTIDWVAAGRKAYESRLRNEAARLAAAANGAPVPPVVPKPPKVRAAIPRTPLTEADYVTRLTAAIQRGVKADDVRMASVAGKDMGGGWIVLATDGHRALTRRVAPGEKPTPVGTKPITRAEAPRFGLTLTPALEHAILRARIGVDKKAPEVRLVVDPTTKTVTITGRHLAEPLIVTDMPRYAARAGKLEPVELCCDIRYLADAVGRGGRLGWDRPAKKGMAPPYIIDPSATLRYVFMPIRGGA